MLMHACNHGIRRRNLTWPPSLALDEEWSITQPTAILVSYRDKRTSSVDLLDEHVSSDRGLDAWMRLPLGMEGRLRAADDYSCWLGFLGWRHARSGRYVAVRRLRSIMCCLIFRQMLLRPTWWYDSEHQKRGLRSWHSAFTTINFYLETEAKVWEIHILRVYVKYILLHSIELLSLHALRRINDQNRPYQWCDSDKRIEAKVYWDKRRQIS